MRLLSLLLMCLVFCLQSHATTLTCRQVWSAKPFTLTHYSSFQEWIQGQDFLSHVPEEFRLSAGNYNMELIRMDRQHGWFMASLHFLQDFAKLLREQALYKPTPEYSRLTKGFGSQANLHHHLLTIAQELTNTDPADLGAALKQIALQHQMKALLVEVAEFVHEKAVQHFRSEEGYIQDTLAKMAMDVARKLSPNPEALAARIIARYNEVKFAHHQESHSDFLLVAKAFVTKAKALEPDTQEMRLFTSNVIETVGSWLMVHIKVIDRFSYGDTGRVALQREVEQIAQSLMRN